MNIEQRSATITASNLDERTLTARAVPYNEATCLHENVWERFEPDALEESPLGIKLRFEHDTTIGTITRFENRSDGAYITAKISDTAAGRDAYTLLKDGALTSVSIGFRSNPDTMEIIQTRDRTDVIHHRAELLEVSLVTFPAYANAIVTNVRSLTTQEEREKPMETTDQLADIRAALDEHTRRFDAITDQIGANEPSPTIGYRSFGDYVKAVTADTEAARRSYEGATSTDLGAVDKPAWLNRTLTQMIEKQRITHLFRHAYDLPPHGMSIEFPMFGEDSLTVSKQDKQGADLPFGKITLSTGTAPIITYGGGTEVSRQIIDRSSSLYLDTTFTRMALHYAKTIEQATQALLNASIKTRLNDSDITIAKANVEATTVDDWIDTILAAAEYYDGKDFPLTGLVVNSKTFKHLAKLDQAPKALKFSETTDRTQGEITVSTLSGSIASLPVTMAPIEHTAAFYTTSALEIHESPGAPLRLQDENIVNLSQNFAVYGYAAHYAPDLSALVPVKVAA